MKTLCSLWGISWFFSPLIIRRFPDFWFRRYLLFIWDSGYYLATCRKNETIASRALAPPYQGLSAFIQGERSNVCHVEAEWLQSIISNIR